ncbi:MAG: PilZ domain-containing protein [Alphaproteobacteria bacterium]|nr:PilZ domain-containing protein [Alphaproteobacteria bacterium]
MSGANAVSSVPGDLADQPDRRAYQRTEVCLHGRLHVEGHHPSHCTIVDLSPGGACVETRNIPQVGTRIMLDIAATGRIEGIVVRSDPFDFGVQFTLTDTARSRLADQIVLQFNRKRLDLSERRASDRESVTGESDPVEFGDGQREFALIKDVSMTGVAFFSDRRPPIGMTARVGVMTGTVARHLDDGYAIAFDPPKTPV